MYPGRRCRVGSGDLATGVAGGTPPGRLPLFEPTSLRAPFTDVVTAPPPVSAPPETTPTSTTPQPGTFPRRRYSTTNSPTTAPTSSPSTAHPRSPPGTH